MNIPGWRQSGFGKKQRADDLGSGCGAGGCDGDRDRTTGGGGTGGGFTGGGGDDPYWWTACWHIMEWNIGAWWVHSDWLHFPHPKRRRLD